MTRTRKILLALLGVAVGLIAAYFLIDRTTLMYSREADFAIDTVKQKVAEVDKPVFLYGIQVNNLHVLEDVVRRNQRFTDLLLGFYVPANVAQQFSKVPRDVFDFRKITMNKKYMVIAAQDSLRTVRAVVYESSPVDYFVFHMTDSVYIEAGHREVVIEEKEVAGVIGSTLYETISKLGVSAELTNRFVDIFAWQVDFQRLQKGDRFKLFYEEQQIEGEPIGIGQINGIYFQHFNRTYYAIPFDQGEGVDYFDQQGGSLRKALLKYPIEFTRISSRYNLRRFHPIAKVVRAHRGTDFAAPSGTPIRSVGDGTVLEAQYNGNNGNYVKIRHNGTFTTQYLHMSRIAAGLRPGGHVRRGETIGFVGSTGLATGPHLCYRFWRNGIQVDALRIELPPSKPVQEHERLQFETEKLRVIKRLDQITLPEPPTLASGG